MTPLLKDISAIPKRVILRIGINRAVIRSDNIDLRELNEREGRKLKGERAKRKNGNRRIKCDCVVNRSSGKLERR
jgi:hypothetical protein